MTQSLKNYCEIKGHRLFTVVSEKENVKSVEKQLW